MGKKAKKQRTEPAPQEEPDAELLALKRGSDAIIYKDDANAKAAELEAFLFGSGGGAGSLFDTTEPLEEAEDAAAGSIAEMLRMQRPAAAGPGDESGDEEDGRQDEPAMFWEDRGEGDAGALFTIDTVGSRAAAAAGGGAAAGPRARKAVWEDPADRNVTVNIADKARLRKLRKEESQKALPGSKYEGALRAQHQKLNPRTGWADAQKQKQKRRAAAAREYGAGSESDSDPEAAGASGDDDENEDASALLRTAGGLLARRSGPLLPAGLIEMTRVKDANQAEPAAAVIQSVDFHPNGQLLMAAGLDKKLRLFQVDGLRNAKVQSVHLEDMPVHKAAFALGGDVILAAGRRAHFYTYDLHAGRVQRVLGQWGGYEIKSLESFAACSDAGGSLVAFLGDQGYVPLVSLKSRQWVANLKMNGSVRAAAFSKAGLELLTLGGDGVVYTWDMRTRRCLSQTVDEGCLKGTALAVSPNDRYFASGSSAGVVNLYERPRHASVLEPLLPGGRLPAAVAAPAKPGAAPPLKTLMNLTTTIDSLAFNHDCQMLAMASRMKKDSLRLVHLPSGSVFSNWPTSRTPLHYVHCLAFSPRGGYLAAGNAKGKVLLYRIHHYAEA